MATVRLERNTTLNNTSSPENSATQPKKGFHKISIGEFASRWFYVSRINVIARSLLNAAANSARIATRAGKNFPHQVKILTNSIKILTVVNLSLTVVDLKNMSKSLFKSFSLGDKEGIALGMLSWTLIATDAFDTMTGLVNATLTLANATPVAVFSKISLPMGLFLSTFGIVSRGITFAKTHHLHQQIKNDILSKRGLKCKLP